jgi:hypothetical protein
MIIIVVLLTAVVFHDHVYSTPIDNGHLFTMQTTLPDPVPDQATEWLDNPPSSPYGCKPQ